LTGTFDAHHAQLAKSMLRRLELVELALAELDAVIAEACRPWQHQIELLQTIPGVGETVAQVIVAETGADMSRFPSAAHLAAWAGLAPALHESAGRQTPAGKRHGNKWLTAMLVEAAGSVGRMRGKNYLAAQHARGGAAWAGPRSPSRTRCWCRPTGCSNATSPTTTSEPTGTADAATKPTRESSSPSSNASGTP
jgi:transposase